MLLAALSVLADVVLISFFNKTQNKRKQKTFDKMCKRGISYHQTINVTLWNFTFCCCLLSTCHMQQNCIVNKAEIKQWTYMLWTLNMTHFCSLAFDKSILDDFIQTEYYYYSAFFYSTWFALICWFRDYQSKKEIWADTIASPHQTTAEQIYLLPTSETQ